ncbi:MAG TPA: sulfatase-like hydrolase/transferase [Thermoanaerobaculia bacterium]|jgi:arylsulfatase A-like enzyme|nr:sulfatase-like hydrolase/transferase [Thermoanaerobaculia bacterium]
MPASPPNILFIHVDELRYPMHFPAGINSAAEFFARFMPHLHELLWKDGVKFSRYYTAGADCTAGRGTFVTGLYAHQTNLMVIRQGKGSGPAIQPPLQPEFPTYGKLLREVGYDTPYIGKWHLSDSPASPSSLFADVYLQDYGFQGLTMPDPIGAVGQGIGATLADPADPAQPPGDTDIARQAIEWLSARAASGNGIPFCLTVGFVNPHDKQWFWSGTEARRFRHAFEKAGKTQTPNGALPSGEQIVHEANPPSFGYEMPKNWQSAKHLSEHAASICSVFRSLTDFACGGISDDPADTDFTVCQSLLDDTFNTAYAPFSYWTRALDMYTQAMIDVDEQIGQLLENIPDALLDNMVIIFTSDHGEYGSSHGLQGKGITAYEEGMRVPLIVRDHTGAFTRDAETERSQVASHVDLLPLMMKLATGADGWMNDDYRQMYGHRLDLAAILHDACAPGRPYAIYSSDEHFIPAAVNYLNAPEHVVGLAFPEGKLAVYAHWVPETEWPLFKITEYYDYATEDGRLELASTPDCDAAKAAVARLNDEVIPNELRAPLPAAYVEAQKTALRKYWGYVLLLDTASELVLKVGAP